MDKYILEATYTPDNKTIRCKVINHVTSHKITYYITDAKPVGGWTSLIFDLDMRYYDFLLHMVQPSVEVGRHLAHCALRDVKEPYKIQALNAIRILDFTFYVPWLNLNMEWQRNFLDEFLLDTCPRVIHSCVNQRKLYRYFHALTGSSYQ